jgi:hypothetical protein
MARIDTSMYRRAPSAMDAFSGISDSLNSYNDSMRRNKLSDLAMQQQQFNISNSQRQAQIGEEKIAEAERLKRIEEQKQQEFMAQYQTAQMEEGEQLSPEKMQEIYANVYPERYAEQQMKSTLGRDPYAGRRLDIQEKEHERKSLKDKASLSNFNKKQQLEREKFYLSGQKNEEQIRQFEESMAMKREEIALELNKPERERKFAQEGYRLQLPEYLQGKAKPSKVFTQTEITKLKDANNSYGDIYKKVGDLQSLVPTASDFMSAKGTGETAGLVRSQVAQMITDYNRNIAELGALAGQDLTILEEAIPSPSQWKAMTYSTWKKTMKNLEKNIKEKYQGLMRNSDINITGNLLDTIANQARVTTLTSDDEGLIRK